MNNELKAQSLDNLATKIVFLAITCERYGNLRTSNVALNTTASEKRFHTTKKLLNSPELKMIAKRDAEVKRSIEALCLPYEIGLLTAPVANTDAIRSILKAYAEVERPILVKAVIAAYPQRIAEAKAELKEEFNAADYVPVEAVAEEFKFKYRFTSLSMPEGLKDEAHKTIMDAASGIADALALAAHECVSKLADSLSTGTDGKAKKIYDVHFTKLTEFLSGFDIRNVTDNAALKVEMDKLKAIMQGVDPDKVRENDGLRADIQQKMSQATAELTAMVQHKGRKFRDVEEPVA